MALQEFLLRRRPAINAIINFRNRNLRKQIFFSHSSQDHKLINLIEHNLKQINVDTFFARNWITGEEPLKKVMNALWNSRIVFILLTKNVMNNHETREWVSFETGIAKMLAEFNYFQIYGWSEYDIKLTDLFSRITDFRKFNPYDEKSCLSMVQNMMDLASQL